MYRASVNEAFFISRRCSWPRASLVSLSNTPTVALAPAPRRSWVSCVTCRHMPAMQGSYVVVVTVATVATGANCCDCCEVGTYCMYLLLPKEPTKHKYISTKVESPTLGHGECVDRGLSTPVLRASHRRHSGALVGTSSRPGLLGPLVGMT
jgi:hypothetical protein